MAGLIEELSRRAAHAGAALCVYDSADNIIFANQAQKELYPFIEFCDELSFSDMVFACVKNRKVDDQSFYQSPSRWMGAMAHFRRLNRFSQSLTRHMDGRIVQITYERLDGAEGQWYQMRRDVTHSTIQRIRNRQNPLAMLAWDQSAVAPMQTPFLTRLLDTIPMPAALITDKCQIIDGNIGFSNILLRGDGPTLREGRLNLRCGVGIEATLSSQIMRLHRRRQRTPVTLRVPRLDHQPPYLLTLSEPRAEQLGWDARPDHILMITIADPDTIPFIKPHTIAGLLQISEDDGRLILEIFRSSSGENIDGRHRRLSDEIEEQAAQILLKTGCDSLECLESHIANLSYIFGPKAAHESNDRNNNWRVW